MKIIEISSGDNKLMQKFLHLPFRIYKDIPQWVPPLLMDERARFDKHKFPYYKHSEAAFFLALEGSKAIGRLAILNNHLFNDYNNEHVAFFYLFESENHPEAAASLFHRAFQWARTRNLTKILGPKGFTPLDGFGMLVQGFEHRPSLGIPYNPPYYPGLVEGIGFSPDSESVSGYLDATLNFPERIHELSLRIQQRRNISILRFKNRKDLKAILPNLKELYNGALQGTENGTPLTDADVRIMANQILWFADPSLIKIIVRTDPVDPTDRKMIGFLLAYPDISAAFQKTGGRIFPFGWIPILRELKRTDWININGAGLLEEYRGLGGTALLFSEMYNSVVESGQFRHADIVQIGLENQKMQREMENFGINFYKKHRVYSFTLD